MRSGVFIREGSSGGEGVKAKTIVRGRGEEEGREWYKKDRIAVRIFFFLHRVCKFRGRSHDAKFSGA